MYSPYIILYAADNIKLFPQFIGELDLLLLDGM